MLLAELGGSSYSRNRPTYVEKMCVTTLLVTPSLLLQLTSRQKNFRKVNFLKLAHITQNRRYQGAPHECTLVIGEIAQTTIPI